MQLTSAATAAAGPHLPVLRPSRAARFSGRPCPLGGKRPPSDRDAFAIAPRRPDLSFHRAVALSASMAATTPARGVVFIATSLDGYIAREDGGIDWLDAANATVTDPTQDMGYGALMASVQCLVMGRNTYDVVAAFPDWPYGDKKVVVLSRSPGKVAIPPAIAGTVSATSEDPAALMARLGNEGVSSVYVDGGSTIRSFMAAGLVDRITVTRIPVLLGKGVPLFGGSGVEGGDVKLKHVETQSWEWGFVQSTYDVVRG